MEHREWHDDRSLLGESPIDATASIIFKDSALYTRMRNELYEKYAQPPEKWDSPEDFNLYQMAMRALDLQPGERVLEAACGGGEFYEAIARSGHKGDIIGVDTSEFAYKTQLILEADGFSNTFFLQGDARNLRALGIGPKSIDKAVINYGLYHINQPENVLRSLHEALADNGRLVTLNRGDMNMARHWQFIQSPEILNELGIAAPENPYLNFDSEDVPKHFARTGFELVSDTEFSRLSGGQLSIFRHMYIPEEGWDFYAGSMCSFLMAAIVEQSSERQPKRNLNKRVREAVDRIIKPKFMAEVRAYGDFHEIAQDGLAVAIKRPI